MHNSLLVIVIWLSLSINILGKVLLDGYTGTSYDYSPDVCGCHNKDPLEKAPHIPSNNK